MTKTPKIWLTGSRGFIGKALCKALRQDNVDLTCFTQTPGPAQDVVLMDYAKAENIQETVKSLGLPDVFIHLGWPEVSKPDLPVHLNEGVATSKTLLETMFKLGLKKFIFTGSISQYGGLVGRLSEDMAPGPRLTNYAKAKNEVEQLGLQAAQTYGKIFISVRIPWAFGAGQRQGSLINDIYQAHLKGTMVSLSPCEHYRDYIHTTDVVEGLRRVGAVEESGIINLGSGKFVQVKDFVMGFWKNLGGDRTKLKFGDRPLPSCEPDQPKSYFDLTRLIRLTQWQPRLSLDEGIRKTIEDLSKENAAGTRV